MTHVGDPTLGRVVLEEDPWQILPRPPTAKPLLCETVQLDGPLHDHDVDVLPGGLLRGQLSHRRGPVPCLRPAATIRSTVGQDRHQVFVVTLDKSRRPGPVDMPEKDLHEAITGAALTGVSCSIAAMTCSTVTSARHGCPWRG